MRRETATIIELPDGWLWAEHGRMYRTAANALRAVMRSDQKARDAGVSTVRIVNWELRTKIGRQAVRALQS